MSAITEVALPESLEELSPEGLLEWAYGVHRDRAAIFTSFQNTGCVMIDMAQRVAPGLRVVTVDTMRLHPETYAFMETLERRYGIQIERFQPDPQRVANMVADHGEYLFFDSRGKQELCCRIRKVEPNERALETVDVWITGLRREQSKAREKSAKVSTLVRNGRRLIKVCPLVDWSDQDIRAYMDERGLPHNPLYDQGYENFGCVICSTPTLPGEDKRAGRWRWQNQLEGDHHKECGIHVEGSGI